MSEITKEEKLVWIKSIGGYFSSDHSHQVIEAIRQDIEAADSELELLRDIASCGAEYFDPRIRWVDVQVDLATWEKLEKFGALSAMELLKRFEARRAEIHLPEEKP